MSGSTVVPSTPLLKETAQDRQHRRWAHGHAPQARCSSTWASRFAALIAFFPILRVFSVALRPGNKLLDPEFTLIPEGATPRGVPGRPVRQTRPAALALQQPRRHDRHVDRRRHHRGDVGVRLQPLQVPGPRDRADDAPRDPAHPGGDAPRPDLPAGRAAQADQLVRRHGHRPLRHRGPVQHLDPEGLLRHGADRARGGGPDRRLLAAGGVLPDPPAALDAGPGDRLPVQLPGRLERLLPRPRSCSPRRTCSRGHWACSGSSSSSRRSGTSSRRRRSSSRSRSSRCSSTRRSGSSPA